MSLHAPIDVYDDCISVPDVAPGILPLCFHFTLID